MERLNSYFLDYYGDRYDVKVYDDDYSGSSISVDTTMCSLSYDGSIDQIHRTISAAALEYGFLLNRSESSASDIISFLADLSNAEEGRFWVTVEKVGASNYMFLGILLIEEANYPNAPIGEIKLNFVDGLSLLEGIDYKPTSSTFYDIEAKVTLWDHLKNCFELLPSFGKYENADDFLTTSLKWANTEMVSTSNFLDETRVPHSLFTSVDDEGNYSASSVMEVAQTILKPFHLNISYDPTPYNNYLLRHNKSRISTEIQNERRHKPTWAVSIPLLTQSRINPYDLNVLAGGSFGFMTGLNKVEMDFDYNASASIVNTYNQADEPSDYVVMGNFQITDDTESLVLFGDLEVFWDSVFMFWKIWGFFNMFIKVTNGTKTVYYKNEWTDQTPNGNGFVDDGFRSVAEWSSSEASIGVETDFVRLKSGNYTTYNTFVHSTDYLTNEFSIGDEIEVSVKFELLGKYLTANAPNYFEAYGTEIVDYLRTIFVSIVADGESTTSSSGLTITGLINEKNSKTLDYDIKLGYGQNSSNSNLEINTSNGWQVSKNTWNLGSSGEYYLYDLIIREFYAMRKNTILKYEGSFFGRNLYGNMITRLNHGDQEQFYPIRCSHDLHNATININGVQPTTFIGIPDISFFRNAGESSSSNASNYYTSNTSSVEENDTNGGLVKKPIEFTTTGNTAIISDIIMAADDSEFNNSEMELYVYLKRNNTPLRYESGAPDRMEFKAAQSGDDVIITLGQSGRTQDVFRGWILTQ